jgi:hypothetical protein
MLFCVAKMKKGKDSWRQAIDILKYNIKRPQKA